MTWKSRLKIAREIAYAVAYLHTAFSRPIVHRNIISSSIFLDEHNNAKLSDFSLSVSIHENETLKVGRINWKHGYVSPEYGMHGEVTEKIDVYSFGALLLEFLTGRHPRELIEVAIYLEPQTKSFVKHYATCHSMDEIMDHRILAEGGGINERQQGKAVIELALKCLETAKEQRPTMVEVTKQLIQIERFVDSFLNVARTFLPSSFLRNIDDIKTFFFFFNFWVYWMRHSFTLCCISVYPIIHSVVWCTGP